VTNTDLEGQVKELSGQVKDLSAKIAELAALIMAQQRAITPPEGEEDEAA
jgi:outer membrane murein-binding lipoprotein Lpp